MTSGLGGFQRPGDDLLEAYKERAFFATGRSSLRAILHHLDPPRVHLPAYTCPVVHELVTSLGSPAQRYHIDDALRPMALKVEPGEVVILNNYFGCFPPTAPRVGTIILDHAQAFFAPTPSGTWSFDSARKFLPCTDGSFVQGPSRLLNEHLPMHAATGEHLLCPPERAHASFLDAEQRLREAHERGSASAFLAIQDANIEAVQRARRDNWTALHDALGASNRLKLPPLGRGVPLAYPYLPEQIVPHQALHAQSIWVPRYWPGLDQAQLNKWERTLATTLLPLPCDQRYGSDAMARIVRAIQKLAGK